MTDSTVIRSGYGITYHSHPWGAQALRGWFPLTVVAVFDGVNGYQPVTTSPGYVAAGVPNAPLGPTVGIPSICCPDISTGRVPLPLVAETGYPVANQELHRGYIQSWNLIVERKLPAQFRRVAWDTSGRRRSAASRSSTSTPRRSPGPATRAARCSRSSDAPRPRREWDGRTHSIYHSLQTSLNRRFSGGLLIKAAYTFSKAIDEAPYSDWTEFLVERAECVCTAIVRLRTTTSRTTSSSPPSTNCRSAATKKWATTGTSAAIFGGWQLNGIFAAYSGRPFTLTASDASLNMPGNMQTPDQVKENVEILGKVGDDGTWFDTSAFARVTDVRFGNVGRNTMRGPGVVEPRRRACSARSS